MVRHQTAELPAELIDAYLRAARDPGKYQGFGRLGISWKQNRDRALSAQSSCRARILEPSLACVSQ